MELDYDALCEDAAVMRANLCKAHCMHANDVDYAKLALYSALLDQARIVLLNVYQGDRKAMEEHERGVIDTLCSM